MPDEDPKLISAPPIVPTQPAPVRRLPWKLLAGAALLLVVLSVAIPKILHALHTVSTDDAYINSYVTFVAPRVTGQVARVSVEDNNFKETQLCDLHIGQRVNLEPDMYGGKQHFGGRISGFTMGTGSTLALLPAQNATGNFVKVVQRLPVRIDLVGYLNIPRELRGAAVGLLALLRNEGGSVGVSLSQTLQERREYFHALRLNEILDPLDPVAAGQMALQSLENLRGQQASGLAYFDAFFAFGVVGAGLAFAVLFMKRSVIEKGAHIAAE